MLTAQSQTYLDSEWIRRTLIQKYKGGLLDEDELKSIADEAFVVAYIMHDEKKSDFSSWCFSNIQRRIIDEFRKRKRFPKLVSELEAESKNNRREEFFEWVEELSLDSQFIVQLVINKYPRAMKKYLEFYGKEDGDTIRNALREYLSNNLKWNKKRTNQTFEEIRKALKRR